MKTPTNLTEEQRTLIVVALEGLLDDFSPREGGVSSLTPEDLEANKHDCEVIKGLIGMFGQK